MGPVDTFHVSVFAEIAKRVRNEKWSKTMRFISNSNFGANLLLPAALHNNEFGCGLLVKTNWKKQEKRALAQNLKSQPEILKNQRRLPLGNREFR